VDAPPRTHDAGGGVETVEKSGSGREGNESEGDVSSENAWIRLFGCGFEKKQERSSHYDALRGAAACLPCSCSFSGVGPLTDRNGGAEPFGRSSNLTPLLKLDIY
jgi:hypothetical protein